MLLFVKFLSVLLLPVRCVPVFSGTLQLILLSIGFLNVYHLVVLLQSNSDLL